jgi:hypothetical protein
MSMGCRKNLPRLTWLMAFPIRHLRTPLGRPWSRSTRSPIWAMGRQFSPLGLEGAARPKPSFTTLASVPPFTPPAFGSFNANRKHGNTLIAALRQTYGQHFAPGIKSQKKLEDVLHILASLRSANWLTIFTADGGGLFQVKEPYARSHSLPLLQAAHQ